MQYEFTDNLITHNELIDSEHKNLIEQVNILFIYLQAWDKNIDKLKGTLEYLANYVDTHFEHENMLMRDYAHPETTQHMAWHNAFRHEVRLAAEAVSQTLSKEGPTPTHAAIVIDIAERLVDHIKGFDMRLAQHIQTILCS